MRRTVFLLAMSLAAAPAGAYTQPGQTAVDFSRSELAGGAPGPLRMLDDYPGKILLVFQLGYS